MRKKLVCIPILLTCLLCVMLISGCEDKIPNDYEPLSINDSYTVTVTAIDSPIKLGDDFHITVTTENKSGRVLFEETNSTLYKKGAVIKLKITLNGQTTYLINDLQTQAEDIRVQKIKKDEVIVHTWNFTALSIDNSKTTPIGKYTLEIEGIEEINDFLEIIA